MRRNANRSCEWLTLEAHWPGRAGECIGILLRDCSSNRLHVKIQANWWRGKGDELDDEIWAGIHDELVEQSNSMGANAVLQWLEETVSHVLRVGCRSSLVAKNAERALVGLFEQHCVRHNCSSKVRSPRRITWDCIFPRSVWFPIAAAAASAFVIPQVGGPVYPPGRNHTVHPIVSPHFSSEELVEPLIASRENIAVSSEPGSRLQPKKSDRLLLSLGASAISHHAFESLTEGSFPLNHEPSFGLAAIYQLPFGMWDLKTRLEDVSSRSGDVGDERSHQSTEQTNQPSTSPSNNLTSDNANTLPVASETTDLEYIAQFPLGPPIVGPVMPRTGSTDVAASPPSDAPEPRSLFQLVAGLILVGVLVRKRRSNEQ